MADPAAILQLKIKASRVAEFRDRGWIQRKNDCVLDRGELGVRTSDHGLNGVLFAFALAPVFQTTKGERGILAATVKAETSDRDEALDFRLLEEIFLDLLEDRVCALLGGTDRELNIRDEVALVLSGDRK